MRGIVEWIITGANSAKRGQLAVWSLGLLIFFDDYSNTLVVGNTSRSITDRLRISREKLAYLVDSTAAPLATATQVGGADLEYKVQARVGGKALVYPAAGTVVVTAIPE